MIKAVIKLPPSESDPLQKDPNHDPVSLDMPLPIDQTASRLPPDVHQRILSHLDFASEFARRKHAKLPRRVSLDEVKGAAFFGLTQAAIAYDQDRNISFKLYCSWRMRGAINDFLRELDHLSISLRRNKKLMEEVENSMRHELKHEPDPLELAKVIAKEGLNLQSQLDVYRADTSALDRSSAKGNRDSLSPNWSIEAVPDTRHSEPPNGMWKTELLDFVSKALNPTEFKIIYYRYFEDLPFREIAELMGLSEGRTHELHRRTLDRLSYRCARKSFNLDAA